MAKKFKAQKEKESKKEVKMQWEVIWQKKGSLRCIWYRDPQKNLKEIL